MGTSVVGLRSDNMANLRILCVLIVLAAVSWQANSWGTQSWSVKGCNGGHLKPWCGRYGVLMIANIMYGKPNRWSHHLSYSTGSHTDRVLRKAIDKCNWHSSCNVNSKWLAHQGGLRPRGYFCLKLMYKCTHLTAKHSGWDQCSGRGWRLHVATYTSYHRRWKHVNHMPASYRRTWHKWAKKCNGKKKCNFQPRIWPSARITCLPYDLKWA